MGGGGLFQTTSRERLVERDLVLYVTSTETRNGVPTVSDDMRQCAQGLLDLLRDPSVGADGKNEIINAYIEAYDAARD